MIHHKLQVKRSPQEQLELLIQKKFHRSAGLTKKEFLKYCAKIQDRGLPKKRAKDPIWVIPEEMVPIQTQASLLGVRSTLKYLWELEHKGKKIKRPYLIWNIEDGSEMTNICTNFASIYLKRRKRFMMNTVEGLALFREEPDILNNHNLLLGQSFHGNMVLALILDPKGQATLTEQVPSYPGTKWGAPSYLMKR